MINKDIDVLTEKLHNLILRNRQEEADLIQRIKTLQEQEQHIERQLTGEHDDPSPLLSPGTRVKYATNGTFTKYSTGTVVRHTRHRVVICPDKGTVHVYRAKNNVKQIEDNNKYDEHHE